MKKTLLITTLSLIVFMTQAQQGPQFDYDKMKEVSTAYFDAYSKLDAVKMVSFYHDDIEYHDQTYAGYGGQPLVMKGKSQIQNAFETQFFPAAKKFDWNEENRFFSGNIGVFRGTLTVHYKGTIAGKSADETVLWSVPYVTVLHFKDGKIVKELDYVAYPDAVQK